MPPSYVVASSSFESSWRGCGQSTRRGQACARPREGGVGIVRGMLTGRGDCRHREGIVGIARGSLASRGGRWHREGDVGTARGTLTWRGGRWHREGDVDMARGSLAPRGGYNARSCQQRASMRHRQLNGCGRHRHAAVSLRRFRGNPARGVPANRATRHGTPRQPHGEGLRLRQLDGERLRPRQSHGEARWGRDHGDWGGAAPHRHGAAADGPSGQCTSKPRDRK
mgnify:CR=1 FL=1